MARRAELEKVGIEGFAIADEVHGRRSGRSNYNYSSQRILAPQRTCEYGAGFEAPSNPITLYRYHPQQAPLVCINPASATEEVVFTVYEAAQQPYEANIFSDNYSRRKSAAAMCY